MREKKEEKRREGGISKVSLALLCMRRNTIRKRKFQIQTWFFFARRKYFNESYYYLDESVGTATPAPSIVPDWDIEPQSTAMSVEEDAVNGGLILGTKPPSASAPPSHQQRRTAIPAHLFIPHVASLHADAGAGFAREYRALQAEADAARAEIAADSSCMADNKSKNRYHNVVACE